jgi:PAS domain S-box-containing protein
MKSPQPDLEALKEHGRRLETALCECQNRLGDLGDLRQSEAVLRSFFNAIPESVSLFTTDGTLRAVNETFAARLGKTVADCEGQSIYDLIPPKLAESRRREVEAVIATRQGVVFEDERGGRWLRHSLYPVFDTATEVAQIAVYALDITERRNAEMALRESLKTTSELLTALRLSENMFRSIAENTFDMVSLIDLEGRYIYCNPSYSTTLGYPAAEMTGESAFSIVHPEEREMVTRYFAEKLANGERAAHIRLRLICRDGAVKVADHRAQLLLDEQGRPQKVLMTASDVTELTQTEAALRDSQQKLERIINSVDDVLYSIDAQTREFVFLSPAFERLLGFTQGDIEGMGGREAFLDRVIEDGQFARQRQEFEALKHQERTESPIWEAWWLARDGRRICLEDRSSPIYQDGRLLLIQGVLRDVTERKKNEEEHFRLEEQLRQAHKMESVGRLAGGVAHDFNNMLGVILGHVELALEQIQDHHPLFPDLEEIQKAALRSADLTRQLLAFARKQTIHPKSIDLNQTIVGMLKMLKRLIGENVSLLWKPGTGLWPVFMDPTQMDQILANLAVNARDAIGNVGEWTLQTGNITLDEHYCQDNPQCLPGEFVLLSVSDSGCGMSGEVVEHIFEPFYTTKDQGKGTGLGLATIYGIVQQNHGFITVYSEVGLGTTFNIYLPRHLRQVPQEKVLPKHEAQSGGKEFLLLVEDEPAILKLGQLILKRYGYHVRLASSPLEAVKLVEKQAQPLDLLITDVIMPGMNGRELFLELKKIYPDLRCLFMSGYSADIIAHHGLLDQKMNYLQKPFTVHELASQVRRILDLTEEKKDG